MIYILELKQIVDYPRVRIHRKLIQESLADESLSDNGSNRLFRFMVLCSFVGLGLGILLLNFIWQLFRNFGAGIGMEAEEPPKAHGTDHLLHRTGLYSADCWAGWVRRCTKAQSARRAALPARSSAESLPAMRQRMASSAVKKPWKLLMPIWAPLEGSLLRQPWRKPSPVMVPFFRSLKAVTASL